MAEMKLYELEMLRSRIYHGEQELISTLTPEQFFALLSHDYDCLLYTSDAADE